jgi:SNF family Na+-dependent transporter
MQRGEFSSTFTFVLAAAGSAVGLGNIWGFPTNAAENGGAAFLLMYLILAFLLAYPALMAELIIGRHTRANMVTALDSIATSQSAKKAGALYRLCGHAYREFDSVFLWHCGGLDAGLYGGTSSLYFRD